jgi:hypothetical protein
MDGRDLVKPWWLLPPGRVHPAWWVGGTALLFWLDYLTGLNTQFPVLYVLPVSVAAWYSGLGPALMISIGMPLFHIALLLFWWQPADLFGAIAATVFRGTVISVMALWFARLSEHERALQQHTRTLEGLLRICSFCKSIRNAGGEWERLEKFIASRSETQFSHGLCPDCQKKYYPET